VEVEHIYDIDKVIEMEVAITPAIVFDDEIKAQGRIPEVEEIKSWLREIKK
jgi:predicted DsbA family dithiol-disulfide isomerase